VTDLNLTVPDQLLDAIAQRVADLLADQLTVASAPTPWLDVQGAAAYIGDAPTSRVYDLTQQAKLKPHRDGRRLLFHRDDLDAYLRGAS
jgi:excisionase family DNA binding protein